MLMLEHLAERLQDEMSQLQSTVSGIDDLMTTEEADGISRATKDWGDNCGRSIEHATHEIASFRRDISAALEGR
jgi:hypothetical protein